jgi:hypothetical protein
MESMKLSSVIYAIDEKIGDALSCLVLGVARFANWLAGLVRDMEDEP